VFGSGSKTEQKGVCQDLCAAPVCISPFLPSLSISRLLAFLCISYIGNWEVHEPAKPGNTSGATFPKKRYSYDLSGIRWGSFDDLAGDKLLEEPQHFPVQSILVIPAWELFFSARVVGIFSHWILA